MQRFSKWQKELIDQISDERACGDGIWLYLKRGHINAVDEVHSIHEDTWSDVLDKFTKGNIQPCNCADCR